MIGERFGNLTDLSGLAGLTQDLNDPQLLLDMMRSPAHDLLVPQLDALVAVNEQQLQEAHRHYRRDLVPVTQAVTLSQDPLDLCARLVAVCRRPRRSHDHPHPIASRG